MRALFLVIGVFGYSLAVRSRSFQSSFSTTCAEKKYVPFFNLQNSIKITANSEILLNFEKNPESFLKLCAWSGAKVSNLVDLEKN